MLSVDASKIRVDEADHRNQEMEHKSSGGRVTTRKVSRERVSRMLSLEESIVAMYAPSGLGIDWVDAGNQKHVSWIRRHPF